MTASRADTRTGRTAAALAAALILAAAPAVAQQTGPIRLAPLPAPTQAAPEPAPTATPEVAPGGIVIEGLGTVAEDAVGTLGATAGGLGEGMWRGTRHGRAVELVSSLPARYPLRTAQALARRLLLSSALPPEGPAGDASLLAARASKLVDLGSHDDALALIAAVDSRAVPAHLAVPAVRARFLSGDVARGCETVAGYDGGYTEVFWQKALIVCQIADGRHAEAALGLDLLREQGVDAGRAFTALALAASSGVPGADIVVPAGDAPDAPLLALLSVAGVAPPEEMLDADTPHAAGTLIALDALDDDLRLRTAHRALRAGLVPVEAVRTLYASLDAGDEAVAAALLDPLSVSSDRWLAYLYLAARGQTLAVARSEALWEAWNSAESAGAFDIVAHTTAPLLADVPTTPDFGWLSGSAARVALVAGDDARARAWYALVVRQSTVVADLARAAALLWPSMRAIGRTPESGTDAQAENEAPDAPGAGPAPASAPTSAPAATLAEIVSRARAVPVTPREPVPWSDTRLSRWIELASAGANSAAVPETLFLLERLGDPVTEAHWQAAPASAAGAAMMPPVAILSGLSRAVADERTGETVLHVLHMLGASPAGAHPGVVGRAVAALRLIGMEADAAALAREAMVAAAGP
jgi:hypothetical protein